MLEKPYADGPLPQGVVAHVQMARSAHTWKADVEAYLAGRGLTTEAATAVCDLIDAAAAGKLWMVGVSELSLREAVDLIETALI